MTMGCYDREGEPIEDTMEWARLMEDLEYKILAQHKVGRGPQGVKFLSTVWLGLNHNFQNAGPPLIFETMLFTHGAWHTLLQYRYATEEEALATHEILRLTYRYNRKQRRRFIRFMIGGARKKHASQKT